MDITVKESLVLFTIRLMAQDRRLCHFTEPGKGMGTGIFIRRTLEKDNVLRSLGHVDEGIARYVFSIQINGSVPLYRLYNPGTRDHFYTTSDTKKYSGAKK